MEILTFILYGIGFFVLGMLAPVATLFAFGLCVIVGIGFWYFILAFVALCIAIYGLVDYLFESLFK